MSYPSLRLCLRCLPSVVPSVRGDINRCQLSAQPSPHIRQIFPNRTAMTRGCLQLQILSCRGLAAEHTIDRRLLGSVTAAAPGLVIDMNPRAMLIHRVCACTHKQSLRGIHALRTCCGWYRVCTVVTGWCRALRTAAYRLASPAC